MRYAIISDLHSNEADTYAVLTQITTRFPDAKVVALGDLYECLVSKKKAAKKQTIALQKAVHVSSSFEALLTFPSVIGNQEERIAKVTGNRHFQRWPATLTIENATLIHGHQFAWDEHWQPTFPSFSTPLVFFGHSHRAAYYVGNKRMPMPPNARLDVTNKQLMINVGAVVFHREWCLYDSEKHYVQFMKA
ncbi:MAG TPA: metallophosphatase family protein [Metalysinibacillus jejuensis]|uniref:Metallophosphatase family protein n=1 Tax=Metalysinibacillus jejuensis TaxID=914327 RepID=A0A921T4Z0_9BACL|nr:metallophosphatase family protein [Metalysinibacillus jejuensis]